MVTKSVYEVHVQDKRKAKQPSFLFLFFVYFSYSVHAISNAGIVASDLLNPDRYDKWQEAECWGKRRV